MKILFFIAASLAHLLVVGAIEVRGFEEAKTNDNNEIPSLSSASQNANDKLNNHGSINHIMNSLGMVNSTDITVIDNEDEIGDHRHTQTLIVNKQEADSSTLVKWRIASNRDDLATIGTWDVVKVEFYSTVGCTGDKIEANGSPIDSNHYPASRYQPISAFDDNDDTIWGGRADAHGLLWVGMEWNNGEIVGANDVKCVKYNDGTGHGSKKVTVQSWSPNGNKWEDIVVKNVEPGDTKVIFFWDDKQTEIPVTQAGRRGDT